MLMIDDFVGCKPEDRHKREESEGFHVFSYGELIKCTDPKRARIQSR